MRKVLLIIGGVVVILVAACAIFVASRQHLTFDAPYPPVLASTDSAIIERGRYIVRDAAPCASCHGDPAQRAAYTSGTDVPLSGGFVFDIPPGQFYARNLTADSATGPGAVSDQAIGDLKAQADRPDGARGAAWRRLSSRLAATAGALSIGVPRQGSRRAVMHAIKACTTSALLLTAACAMPRQFTPQDEATVRAIGDSVVAEIRAGNIDAWAAHFADSARFHHPNGPAEVGRAAILAWAKSFPAAESFSFGPVTIVGEGNIAYGWSSVALKFAGVPADTMKQLFVYQRDASGRWWIQAVSINTDLPLPAPPAPPARRS